ncbi:MAG: aminomethyl-transferring glycine dehydrogenase subunit GcvPA [Deltaproteobacteria bacterium]|nr:aminomethyl-transferring glycine dehydrogenase subunit GcvPA [Deltaproteobacteria bacterium]
MPYIPHTPEDLGAMLQVIGVKNLDELFADIPAAMRPRSFNLPDGLSETAVCERLEALAAKNQHTIPSFVGGGFYNHAIPKAVDALAGRGEFYTAYTPYQPEASQGTLQAIFEYQTAVCRLLEMDVANASVYDGGSAIFEAAMMAARATKRGRIIVDETVNPLYRTMLATLTANLGFTIVTVPHADGAPDIHALQKALTDKAAGVVVQNPNFFGVVSDFSGLFAKAEEKGALSILATYPVMQSVLKTPGEMGADIAVADGQSIGQPLGFGGPYLGIMACTKALVRQIPGRIVGRTVDTQGKTGYVLTLQAREQHIRRAKATSNICSNQALCALRALIHLCLLGPEGLARTAEISMMRAREAEKALTALPGVRRLNTLPFGNEFALVLPKPATEIVEAMLREKIIPGLPVGSWYDNMDNVLLVACTELTQHSKIEQLAAFLRGNL